MKTIITLILCAICLSVNTQNKITIGIYQDARLGLIGDKKGNKAGTLDFKFDVSLQGKQFEWYYFEIRTQYEYAQLDGGKYVSWQVLTGWNLNKLPLEKLEAGIYPTIGTIHRFNAAFFTYGITGDLTYKLFKGVKLSLMYQVIRRSDLVFRWNEQKPMKPSFYVGLKFNLKKL